MGETALHYIIPKLNYNLPLLIDPSIKILSLNDHSLCLLNFQYGLICFCPKKKIYTGNWL